MPWIIFIWRCLSSGPLGRLQVYCQCHICYANRSLKYIKLQCCGGGRVGGGGGDGGSADAMGVWAHRVMVFNFSGDKEEKNSTPVDFPPSRFVAFHFILRSSIHPVGFCFGLQMRIGLWYADCCWFVVTVVAGFVHIIISSGFGCLLRSAPCRRGGRGEKRRSTWQTMSQLN